MYASRSRSRSRYIYFSNACICVGQINSKLEGKKADATHQMFTSDRLSAQGHATCIACLENFCMFQTADCACTILRA